MTLANGRDLALLMFITAGLFAALAPGVALFFAVKGLRILKRKMLPYIHRTQFYFQRAERITERASHIAVKPIITTAGAVAQARYMANWLVALLWNQED